MNDIGDKHGIQLLGIDIFLLPFQISISSLSNTAI